MSAKTEKKRKRGLLVEYKGRKRTLKFTCCRNPNQIWNSHCELRECPSSGKVSRPHFLVDVHLQRVVVAAAEDSVNPDEQHVTVVALDRGKRQDGDPRHE